MDDNVHLVHALKQHTHGHVAQRSVRSVSRKYLLIVRSPKQGADDFHRPHCERNAVVMASLDAGGWNGSSGFLKVKLFPLGVGNLACSVGRERGRN